ncbi:MAG: adenine deaminase [Dehalococcoidia bacterium]|nr:MAG: adenine deaminase [Dehalococcoidia bacterium]
MASDLEDLVLVARGYKPADLILSNAQIVNVFNGTIESGNVAIYNGKIAGTGNYKESEKVIDLEGRYLAPSLINGHTHIESSMLDLDQYAQVVVARGTLVVITDLHELANVCGIDAIAYVLKSIRRLPLDLLVMAPSCVPPTHLETSGAQLEADDLKRIFGWRAVIGLGEMMNYPGVISGDRSVISKIKLSRDKIIDGHAPSLSGKSLNAYVAAGIYSDHESVSFEEASEKLKTGMYIMIREGSSEKNLEALLPLVTDKTYKRCMFVVDDRSCADLLRDGDMDAVVRKAIKLGLEPVRAIQMATINTSEYFGLNKLGAVAPGYTANLIVIDDLNEFRIDTVLYHGRLVATGGKAVFKAGSFRGKKPMATVNIKPFTLEELRLVAKRETIPVIEIIPGQIITKKRLIKIKANGGAVMPDITNDILKLVVAERHHATGNIGIGLVKGFGIKRGALVSSVAHDSHNIIAVGTNDGDIFTGIKELERMQGGLIVVDAGEVIAGLPLPIGGLLSDRPLKDVEIQLERLEAIVAKLGSQLPSPFSILSFLTLPVIPELRLTDLGLVDVKKFALID